MQSFQAGVGVQDITPAPGCLLWGYSARTEPASGELDPLYAKAIAFRANDHTVVWLVLDLGRVPLEADCDCIRQKVSRLGLSAIVIHATHTHHGPAVESLPDAERTRLIAHCVEAIEESVANLQPARVGYGSCEIDIAHNRRIITPDGSCEMIWRNAERRPTSPVDREARIIRIDAESGAPIAVLVHFACHPVVMGPSNLQYSADFVGTLMRIVKSFTDAECLYLQGACGDINPYLDKTLVDEGGIDAAFATGRIAAEAVTAAWHGIKSATPTTPDVGIYESCVEVGVRWNMQDPAERELLRNAHGNLFSRYLQNLGDTLSVPVTVALINREFALVGMPGEFFIEQQLDLKSRAPIPHALLCGYVNGYHAYFPPIAHAAAGGYGGSVATYAGLGAAERLYAEGLIGIHKLLGQFGVPATAQDFAIRDH